MTVQHPYRREIDACRPGSNDLQLPELAELASAVVSDPRAAKELDASHANDIVLCDGLNEVHVPAGLADRLLAAVAEASGAAKVAAVESERTSENQTSVEQPLVASQVSRTLGRRAWFLAVPALAASLAIAAALLFWQQSEPRRFGQAELAGMVEDWYEQAQQREGWTAPIATATTEQFPVDSSVILARPVAQRSIPVAGNGVGVAYDLRRTNRKAVLFVVRTQDHYDVAPLPNTNSPLRTVTGNKQVAAWQSGPLLYVLVVDGNQGSPRDFIRPRDLT